MVRLEKWCTGNALNLKINKANIIYIKNNLNIEPIANLDVVSEIKCLCIVMDQNLKWFDHINYSETKLNNAIYCLRIQNKSIVIHSLKSVYFSYIQTICNYGTILAD